MVATFVASDSNADFRKTQAQRVRVNGRSIPASEIAQEVQNHSAETPREAWLAAARALVVRELLLGEARRKGIAAGPMTDSEGRRETDDEAVIRQLVEQEVQTPEPDEAACRRYYEHNERRFRSGDLYEAAHILIPVRVGDPASLKEAEQLAHVILDELKRAPSAFADLARRHSACPSAEAGGNLGQIGTGDTAPEFEAALVAMLPGEIMETPVATRFGLHIIRLERKIEGRVVPFEAVHERIAHYLATSSERRAAAQYLARLAQGAAIEGIDLPKPQDLGVF